MRFQKTAGLFFAVTFVLAFVVCATAHAAGSRNLGGMVENINYLNGHLKILGKAMTVTGLIIAAITWTLGWGGVNRGLQVLGGGLVICCAQGIIDTLTGF